MNIRMKTFTHRNLDNERICRDPLITLGAPVRAEGAPVGS